MEIFKIIQAICSGKSRKEVYNLLSPEEKDTLNRVADNGLLNRRMRRKFQRNIRELNVKSILTFILLYVPINTGFWRLYLG